MCTIIPITNHPCNHLRYTEVEPSAFTVETHPHNWIDLGMHVLNRQPRCHAKVTPWVIVQPRALPNPEEPVRPYKIPTIGYTP